MRTTALHHCLCRPGNRGSFLKTHEAMRVTPVQQLSRTRHTTGSGTPAAGEAQDSISGSDIGRMVRTVFQAMIGQRTGERARTLKRLNTSSSCSGGSSKPSCDRRVRSALRPLCLPGRPSDTQLAPRSTPSGRTAPSRCRTRDRNAGLLYSQQVLPLQGKTHCYAGKRQHNCKHSSQPILNGSLNPSITA